MERWYHAEHIPTHIVRLYQLLLKLIWMKGIMVVSYAQRLGYDSKVLNQALSKGYVEIVERPSSLPISVQDKIVKIIGKAPREIYA